jgi:hypothetical protein
VVDLGKLLVSDRAVYLTGAEPSCSCGMVGLN